MEATTTAPAMAAPQQQISDFGRIIGVLTSPGTTFADIIRKPKWILPVVLCSILGIAFAYTMNQRIDWGAFIRQQIEKSPRAADMPADQMNRMVNMQAKGSVYFTYFIGAAGPMIGVLLMGGIYLLAFNTMAGAGTNFKTSMSIVAHAFVTALVSSPVIMIIMWMREYGDVDPNSMMASSLYSFLPESAPAWLQSIGNSVELFWFWTMILLAVGFGAINKKKMGAGKALGIIGGIWLVWVFVKTSLAAVFS